MNIRYIALLFAVLFSYPSYADSDAARAESAYDKYLNRNSQPQDAAQYQGHAGEEDVAPAGISEDEQMFRENLTRVATLCGEEAKFSRPGHFELTATAKRKNSECLSVLTELAKNDFLAYFSGYLGQLYLGEFGVPQDLAKAEYWLRKAALLDNINNQMILGYLFSQTNRPIDAQVWYGIAHINRDALTTEGQELLKTLIAQLPALTQEEKLIVDQRIRAYRPLTNEEAKAELDRLGITPEGKVNAQNKRKPRAPYPSRDI